MTSDTESLGQLLDGTLPDDRHVWDFDDEMASYGVFSALVEKGVSIDYVLTGKRAEASQDGQWQQGNPTENGYYWAIYTGKISGGKLVWWQDDHWEPADVAMEITFRPMAWMPANGLPSWCKWERKEV